MFSFIRKDPSKKQEAPVPVIEQMISLAQQLEAELKFKEQEQKEWAEEKRLIQQVHPRKGKEDIVCLNVGGTKFSTRFTILTEGVAKDSLFAAMFSGRHALDDDNGEIFLDRDPTPFVYIMKYLRSPSTFKLPNGY